MLVIIILFLLLVKIIIIKILESEKIFGFGSNYSGQLGLGEKFKLIIIQL